MKHIMNLLASRHLELVCDIVYFANDLERPKELGSQFLLARQLQRCNRAMEQVQPHPILFDELEIPVLAIILQLIMVLGMLQPFTSLHQELITVQ
jgi:hypothetical protein